MNGNILQGTGAPSMLDVIYSSAQGNAPQPQQQHTPVAPPGHQAMSNFGAVPTDVRFQEPRFNEDPMQAMPWLRGAQQNQQTSAPAPAPAPSPSPAPAPAPAPAPVSTQQPQQQTTTQLPTGNLPYSYTAPLSDAFKETTLQGFDAAALQAAYNESMAAGKLNLMPDFNTLNADDRNKIASGDLSPVYQHVNAALQQVMASAVTQAISMVSGFLPNTISKAFDSYEGHTLRRGDASALEAAFGADPALAPAIAGAVKQYRAAYPNTAASTMIKEVTKYVDLLKRGGQVAQQPPEQPFNWAAFGSTQ